MHTSAPSGVWVLNAPDLLFIREKDGKEASREVIVTGWESARSIRQEQMEHYEEDLRPDILGLGMLLYHLLTLTAAGGETSYPEVNCVGKLTRIGASRSYVFYVEAISQGHRDKGGRCPDGTITVGRAGDKLAWVWFGSVDDELVVAYGTLTRNPAR